MRLLIAFLLMLPMAAFGRDTAYQALRTLQSEPYKAMLNRVVEVKGFAGIPQPESWIVVIDDPMARGGVRELEITGGKITSERTPVKGYSGISADSIMNFSRLNLDSKGAFTIAEQEARLAKVNFDALDYVLARDENRQVPVWTLQLLDTELRPVGTIRIAADNGAVLSRRFDRQTTSSPVERGRREVVKGEEVVEEQANHIGRKIDRTARRIGGSLEEFFTGKRTIDRRSRDD